MELNFGHFRLVVDKNHLSTPGCGLSILNRVVHGHEAVESSYPFAALLFKDSKPFGGAVIISEQWILTAAHNTHRFDRINTELFLNFLNLFSSVSSTLVASRYSIGVGSIYISELQVHKVQSIFVHPLYQRKQKFDLALMKLKVPLKFSSKVKAICLPEYSFEPLNSNQGRVIGWGYHHFKVKKVSPVLQEVDLDVIPLERCRRMYAPIKQDIIRSQICTWSNHKDACSGDSKW